MSSEHESKENANEINENVNRPTLDYKVDDVPPLPVTAFYVLQMLCSLVGGPLTITYFVYGTLCADDNPLLLAQLISTSFFMVGLVTLTQTTLGIRLPVIQGSTILYALPALGLAASGEWDCPDHTTTDFNNSSVSNITQGQTEEVWKGRVQEISGGIVLASLMQVVLGSVGITGALLRFIGPLSVGSMIMGIVLDMVQPIINTSQTYWPVALVTGFLATNIALFLGKKMIPLPSYTRKDGCVATVKIPVFRLYSYILALTVGWLICLVLTEVGYFTDDPDDPQYRARTDARVNNIYQSPWIYIPYPCQFGLPTVNPAMFTCMMMATVTSIIDSIGDYYACARICGVPPPPKHAVNRGIAIEGLGGVITGLMGASHGTSTYTGTIGLIGVTKMGSRRVFQLVGIFLMLFGIFGKVGGIFSTIPAPALGGCTMLPMGMMGSIGVTTLMSADMTSSRNQLIFGYAFAISAVITRYIRSNPHVIQTGSVILDQTIRVSLSMCMLLCGVISCVLDNIVPGTKAERGIETMESKADSGDQYEFPVGMSLLRRATVLTYVPCLPTYKDRAWCGTKTSDQNVSSDDAPYSSRDFSGEERESFV